MQVACNQLGTARRRFWKWLIIFAYHGVRFPQESVDLVVSCGGQTLYLNVFLARHLAAKNLFIGSLRGVSPLCFSAVMTTRKKEGVGNQIVLELSPGNVDEALVAEKGAGFRQRIKMENEKLWVIMVGGNGSGYRWDDVDADTLCSSLHAMAKLHDVKWLLSTSRRTPKKLERKLQQFTVEHPEFFAYAVFFRQSPEKIAGDYMGAGDRIFVTEDSTSMISEAIAARKPLVTLAPRHALPDTKHLGFLSTHEEKHRLKSLSLTDAELLIAQAANWHFVAMEHSVEQQIRKSMRALLIDAHQTGPKV
jgi:hypothetical protein